VSTQVSSTKRLLGASAVMASGTMISRVLGVLRVMLVAFILGNGTRQADILDIASMVPNALYVLLAGGALNTVLVPQIVRAVKNDEDGGEAYTNRIMTAFLLGVTVVAVVVTAAAPLVTRLYTSPAWREPDLAAQYASMVALAYLTLPQVFFYGAFFLLGQVLNAREKFGPMMWAPIANNVISILVMAIYLVVWGTDMDRSGPFTTPQILLLGIGSTVGIAAQMLVLLPYLRKVGFRYRPRFDLKGTGLGKTFGLAKWTFAFVGINQLAYMVVQRLATSATATGHGAGSTVYSNAHLLWILPHSLITVSLATAMLPSASRLAAAGDQAGVAAEFTKTVRLALIVIVPATVCFIALAGPATGLLFGHGAGAKDAIFIAWALMAFAVGLIPFTVQFLCLRTFYALEDTRTPFLLQLLIAGVNIVGALLLTWAFNDPSWVATELALAYSVAYAVGVPFSWRVLKRRVPDLDGGKLTLHIVRLLLGSVIGGVGAYYLSRWLLDVIPGRVLGQIAALAAGGVLVLLSFYVVGRLLKVRELSNIGALLAARGGRAVPAKPAGAAGPDAVEFDDDPPTVILPPAGPESIDLDTTGPLDLSDVFRKDSVPTRAAAPETETELLPAPFVDDARDDDAPTAVVPALPAEAPDDEEPTARIAREGTLLSTRYELLTLLAARNGTETWRAHDHSLSRDVVVHVIGSGDDRIVELQAAARKGASATDSRFLRVLDAVDLVDSEQGIGGYVVAEYAAGRSLTELLARGPLSAIEAAYVARELADALTPVHQGGLFHERLNPDNVIITDVGAVKLVGFGLEAVLADGGQWSRPWSAKQRDDVVGVGNLLYAMLVARWPGPGDFGLPPAPLLAGEPAPPHEVLVGVSFALDRICTTTITERGAAGEPRITTTSQLVSTLTQVLGTANASADLEARVRAWTDDVAPPRWVHADPPSASRVPAVPARAFPAIDDEPTGTSPFWGASPGSAETPGSAASPSLPAASGPRTPTSPLGPVSAGSGSGPHRRALWTIAILAVVALVVSLIVVGAMNAKDNAAPASSTPPPSAAGSGSPGPGESPAPEGPIAIAAASDFDPETDGGNGEENPDAVAKAIDGDPATYWETLRYKNRPNLGGLKPGVGVVLDLGEKRTVTAVELMLSADNPDDPTSVEIRVPEGSQPSTRTEADWTVVGANDAAKGTVTIELEKPTETQYLLVYFTRLPPTENGYKARLHEVTVR
jgi:putative peptidoglycan lipid II flippase